MIGKKRSTTPIEPNTQLELLSTNDQIKVGDRPKVSTIGQKKWCYVHQDSFDDALEASKAWIESSVAPTSVHDDKRLSHLKHFPQVCENESSFVTKSDFSPTATRILVK